MVYFRIFAGSLAGHFADIWHQPGQNIRWLDIMNPLSTFPCCSLRYPPAHGSCTTIFPSSSSCVRGRQTQHCAFQHLAQCQRSRLPPTCIGYLLDGKRCYRQLRGEYWVHISAEAKNKTGRSDCLRTEYMQLSDSIMLRSGPLQFSCISD